MTPDMETAIDRLDAQTDWNDPTDMLDWKRISEEMPDQNYALSMVLRPAPRNYSTLPPMEPWAPRLLRWMILAFFAEMLIGWGIWRLFL